MNFNRLMLLILVAWVVLGAAFAVNHYMSVDKTSNDGAINMMAISDESNNRIDALVTDWTRSYELYGYPHAIWLSGYEKVGINQEKLGKTLAQAKQKKQTPEIVIYSIPLRDLGQSSEGGFDNFGDYWSDKLLNASLITDFAKETGISPRIIIEPDALSLSVQYKEDNGYNEESRRIYQERIEMIPRLIELFQNAGAKVYLETAHSDWFDYGDENIKRIATALNDAGIAKADGLVSNVSNRQTVLSSEERNEYHYLSRLLPHLKNKNLDVITDTSRNGRQGGLTYPRQYYLHPDGLLIDNEFKTGRLVGRWYKDKKGETWFEGFYGKKKYLSRLLKKEKFTYNADKKILTAPKWLDPVGDVKLGNPPTDNPPEKIAAVIQRYRHVKPPDDCDGAINCPPGKSKHDINAATKKKQTKKTYVSPDIWL